MSSKTTQAQKNASRRWERNNKERNRYLVSRRRARSFIKKYATREDLEELKKLITVKEKELKYNDVMTDDI